jgi:ankyrin repeat protein
VRVALFLGANINEARTDHASLTALHQAAINGDREVILALCAAGADINARTDLGESALTLASRLKSTCGAITLVNAGADVLQQDTEGCSPLYWTVASNNRELVDLLMDRGAEVNVSATNNVTPLMVATFKGHTEMVSHLLAKGADPDSATISSGWTALMMAAHDGNLAVLEALLKGGASLDATTTTGLRAIDIAAMNGHWSLFEALLRYYFQPPTPGKHRHTPPASEQPLKPIRHMDSSCLAGCGLKIQYPRNPRVCINIFAGWHAASCPLVGTCV